MKGTLGRQSLYFIGTVGASGASYILQDAQCHLLWPGHSSDFINIVLRAAGTAPQSARARSARWGYHGLPPERAVRAAKIKFIITARDAFCKRTVKCLQRSGVSALHAPPALGRRIAT